MLNSEIISEIFDELKSAEKKHPKFPTDPIHAACVLAEELGELQQAVLQWTYENGSPENVFKEAIQTAATSLRFLFHFKYMSPNQIIDFPTSNKCIHGTIPDLCQECSSLR